MIRIRPGRSWRHNPGYLGELRALTPPGARAYGFGGILDVIGLEVDGVDIAAGVGEAPVLLTVEALLAALLQLAGGAGAAQATVGPGPTEVVLEPRGADVLLTLATLRPPARVLAGGLLVDAAKLRAAALQAARSMVRDLLDIAPALAEARTLKAISRSCAQLARRAQQPTRPWPGEAARGAAGFVARGLHAKVACEVQVPSESAGRLAGAASVSAAPLAPLLGRGQLVLRLPAAPALHLEGPPWLLLRQLLRDAGALVHAWEAGERSFALPLGATELQCDLTRDEARASAFSDPARASAVQIASAIASAARAFAERALRLVRAGAKAAGAAAQADEVKGAAGKRARAQAPASSEPLIDLRHEAEELLAHCRDLASGDLRRAPEAVPAPTPRAPLRPPAPLSTGKLRRLIFREAARAQLDPSARLAFCSGPQGAVLLAQTEAQLTALDPKDGRVLWQRELSAAHAAFGPVLRAGTDLLLEEQEKARGVFLVRLDALTGAPRFRRRVRGTAASLHLAAGGLLRVLRDRGGASWSLLSGAGRSDLRGALPEPPISVLRTAGALLFCLPSGLVLGKGAHDGAALFRRRVGAEILSGQLQGTQALLLVREEGSVRLCALHASSGEPLWEHPLPAGAVPSSLVLLGDCAALLCADGVLSVRSQDGARRFLAPLPWPAAEALLCADDELDDARSVQRGPALIVTGPGGATLRLDERGARCWALAGDGAAEPIPALHGRGVLLLGREGSTLWDAAEGLLLARLSPRLPASAALGPDLSVALLDADGALTLHRLATHLSVMG